METDITTRYNSAASALAKLTGMTEGLAKAAIDLQDYGIALKYYNNLIQIHSEKPIHKSMDWVKEWEEKISEIHLLMAKSLAC